jgi:hypothetical protein
VKELHRLAAIHKLAAQDVLDSQILSWDCNSAFGDVRHMMLHKTVPSLIAILFKLVAALGGGDGTVDVPTYRRLMDVPSNAPPSLMLAALLGNDKGIEAKEDTPTPAPTTKPPPAKPTTNDGAKDPLALLMYRQDQMYERLRMWGVPTADQMRRDTTLQGSALRRGRSPPAPTRRDRQEDHNGRRNNNVRATGH